MFALAATLHWNCVTPSVASHKHLDRLPAMQRCPGASDKPPFVHLDQTRSDRLGEAMQQYALLVPCKTGCPMNNVPQRLTRADLEIGRTFYGILIEQARSGQTITYGDLIKKSEGPSPRECLRPTCDRRLGGSQARSGARVYE